MVPLCTTNCGEETLATDRPRRCQEPAPLAEIVEIKKLIPLCLSGLIFIPLRRKRADRDERVAARGRGRRKSFRLRGRRIGWGLLPGHVRGWERIAPFPNGASPPAMAAAPAFRALSPWLIEPADARDHDPPAAWRDGSPTYTPNTGTDFRPAAPPLWGGCLPLVPPALAGRRFRSPKILRAQCRFPSPPLVKKAK
jgi:hypothetical protein